MARLKILRVGCGHAMFFILRWHKPNLKQLRYKQCTFAKEQMILGSMSISFRLT